ncbi:hypothetical protein [Streptosporangium fragile]|uniref:hypothetical protein n=1 Tax=Streptosporangium fragile TaxID=46186 RepID=UPI0031F0EE4D
MKAISGRPPAEEFAEIFSPTGEGMIIPDLFVACRADGPDDIAYEFGEQVAEELAGKEVWLLWRMYFGRASDTAFVEGPELRHLLGEALAQRTAETESACR